MTTSRMSNTGSKCCSPACTLNVSCWRREAFPVFRQLYLNVLGQDTYLVGAEERQRLDSFYLSVSH